MKKQGPPPWGINQVGMRALVFAGVFGMDLNLSDVNGLDFQSTRLWSVA
jgi:hypothetical protein